MKTKTLTFTFALVLFSQISFATPGETTNQPTTDRDIVNTECAKDGKNAKCPKNLIGEKLSSCIQAYHAKHAEFMISPECQTAMGQMNKDKKASH